MTFAVQSTCGRARCGQFSGMQTPALLALTRGGALPYMTPDLVEKLPSLKSVSVTFGDVFQWSKVLESTGSDLRSFTNMTDKTVFLNTRDPTLFPVVHNNDKHCSFDTTTGRRRVKPTEYMDSVKILKPDYFATLADETSPNDSAKRQRKAVNRSLNWLDVCLRSLPADPTSAAKTEEASGTDSKEGEGGDASASSSSSSTRRIRPFGVVVGGLCKDARVFSAKETAKRDVDGFVLGGLGLGESLNQRRKVVEMCVEQLPEDKPRLLLSVEGRPAEVVEAVRSGLDLFSCSYPYSLTMTGCASTFWVGDDAPGDGLAGEGEGEGRRRGRRGGGGEMMSPAAKRVKHDDSAAAAAAVGDGARGEAASGGGGGGYVSKLNLWDVVYEKDKRPLLPGCTCYTCANHSRAYVHHLLQVHELVGSILLYTHNLHHYLRFFASMRRALASPSQPPNSTTGGGFDSYAQKFKDRYV